MDIEGIMLSEISQTEKDKYLCFHSYVKSKKKKNNQIKINKNKLINTENRSVVTRGEAG